MSFSSFPDPPEEAMYREMTMELSGGRELTIWEESVPGDNPDDRRRMTMLRVPPDWRARVRAEDDEGESGAEPAESPEEILAHVEDYFPDPPPGATYRTREVGDEDGRITLIEEVVPGGEPNDRRLMIVEAMADVEDVVEDGVSGPEYDVAITCAGEDRAYVGETVRHLEAEGVKVFYDENEQARLWGKNLLDELVDTYRGRAFRVLMFVSAAYVTKAWTTQERRAALERAMETLDEPYVLPVMLDDSLVPGLPKTTAYVDGRKKSPKDVAELTIDHLREFDRDVAPPLVHREQAARVSVSAVPGKVDDHWGAPYRINNGSDYPLTNVMLVINDPGQDGRPEDQMGSAAELVIGTVAAGEVMEDKLPHLHFKVEPAFGELTHMAALLFTDRWGNHWATGRGELLRCKYPPRMC